MKEIFLFHFHIPHHYRHRGAVVTTPGYESAGPGSIPAWAVGVQVTTVHPSLMGWWINGYLGKPGEGKLWKPGYYSSPVSRVAGSYHHTLID